MRTNNLTLGSLFDGIGGFPYAASFYGVRSLWASEIVPECVSVTRRHFPDMAHVGDVTQLHGGWLPPVDIITFGSPCQGLSLAGQRRGLADERSGLFTEAIRIIDEMRKETHGKYPQFAIFENVPGALSSSGRRDFKAVLEAFTKSEVPMPRSGRWANAGMVRSGGIDLAWVVYDSQHFGTAQRRRRLFLVCDFRGTRAGEILFVPKSLRGYFEAGGTPRQGLAAFAQSSADTAGPAVEILNDQGGDSMTVERTGVSPTLRSQTHGNLPIVVAGFDLQQITSKTNRSALKSVQPTLCASGNPHVVSGMERTDLSPTLRSQAQGKFPIVAAPPVFMGINGNLAGPLDASYYKGTGSRCGKERDVVLCMATGQSHAEILDDMSPTLNCNCEQPILIHPQISGTLCASGAGLARPAGMKSELDLCITSAGFRYKAGSTAGSVGYQEETAPTLMAEQPSGVLQAYPIGDDCAIVNAELLNWEFIIRRLTPLEAERLMGFPDFWTEYGHDGKPISDTKRYSMLGNSVAVPCVSYIMQGIRDVMSRR